MKWERISLKKCCTKIGSGATPKGGFMVYIDKGTSFIRSQNVYNLWFDYDGLVHITEKAAKKLEGVTLEKNDILLNITGDSVARTCMVPEDVLPARVNQHVAIIRANKEKILPAFLGYYLASSYMQSLMLGLAVGKGASRNAITKEMIENFETPSPPLKIQQYIEDVLSAYDELIDNNQKQIKLLEEAAQRLYKEWFVKLHFSGYEHIETVDGLPKGWTKGKIADTAMFARGQTITKEETISGDIPVIAGGLEPAYYHNASNTDCPVITVSGSGANAGYIGLHYDKIWASDCSFVDSLHTKNIYFVYCCLKNKQGEIDNMRRGSAQPHVYAKNINELSVVFPTENIINDFEKTVNNLFKSIHIKKQMIVRAQQARNRLLPKLISGEIEV